MPVRTHRYPGDGVIRTRKVFAYVPISGPAVKGADGYWTRRTYWWQWVTITERYGSGWDDYGWETVSVEPTDLERARNGVDGGP